MLLLLLSGLVVVLSKSPKFLSTSTTSCPMSKPEKHAALQTRSCHTVITTTAHMMMFESTRYPILDPGTTLQVQGHSSMTKTVQLQSFVVSVAGRKSAMPSAHANDSTHENQTCKERQLDGCRACRHKRVYTCMYMYVYIYMLYTHMRVHIRASPYKNNCKEDPL